MNTRIVRQRIRYKLLEAYRQINAHSYDPQGLRQEMQECIRNLRRIRIHLRPNDYVIIENALETVTNLISESDNIHSVAYSANTLNKSTPGRPAISITREQLQLFYLQGFTANKIAKELDCSVSTVYKRCYEENIKFRNKYATINDEELTNKITMLHEKYPNSGFVMMDGYLKSEGLIIQRNRIRKIMAEIDEVEAAKRWSGTIKRRTYRVATPNSLWHIDAHMKLSRWGFATHGCIDGYSRTIIYVSCTTSVTAETVINLFIPAVTKYGLPSRVRSYHGFENLFVAILMNSVRGIRRGSHITGKSVHNQRIERLWRDVFQQVIKSFYDLFYNMEHDGILDSINIMHRYVLHKIYTKEINANLKQFKRAWNYHKIRTEGNRSPHEIWVNGFLSNINSDHTAINELVNNQGALNERLQNIFQHQYGLNTTAIAEHVNATSQATSEIELTEDQSLHLNDIINSNISNIEKYLACTQYLHVD